MGVISYLLMGSSLVDEETETKPQGTRFYLELAAEDQEQASKTGFAPAEAAIDRAVAELKSGAPSADERRNGLPDRRTGETDLRGEGAPERRQGYADRRYPPMQQKTFGKRSI